LRGIGAQREKTWRKNWREQVSKFVDKLRWFVFQVPVCQQVPTSATPGKQNIKGKFSMPSPETRVKPESKRASRRTKNSDVADDPSQRSANEKAFVERWWHELFLRRDALALSLVPVIGKALASRTGTACGRGIGTQASADSDKSGNSCSE
jgi:hypothetical protein